MEFKKILHAIIYPHIAIMILLIPVSVVLCTYSLINLETESVFAIVSYVISAYTLTVWCFKIPKIVKFFKNVKNENKYVSRWFSDERLRVNVTLLGSFLWNSAYAVLQLLLGIRYESAWYYSLAVYYFLLAIMRFFLVRHSTRNLPGEKMREELVRYRLCGEIFLVMNLALTTMIFYMIFRGQRVSHHEIVTIMLAMFTFITFVTAIVNIFVYRKYNSPVYSASKAVNLTAACVSMLTLESTMLATFGNAEMTEEYQKLFLGISGGVLSVGIITMSLYMIITSTKKIKHIKIEENING